MNIFRSFRLPVVWEARHDNGWTTIIAEQQDGSFVAFASNDEAVCVDYVGRNVTHAHAAVIAALRWKSGHRRCTNECSDWRMMPSSPDKAAGFRASDERPGRDHAGRVAKSGPVSLPGRLTA
jgi:hypothetical protein